METGVGMEGMEDTEDGEWSDDGEGGEDGERWRWPQEAACGEKQRVDEWVGACRLL